MLFDTPRHICVIEASRPIERCIISFATHLPWETKHTISVRISKFIWTPWPFFTQIFRPQMYISFIIKVHVLFLIEKSCEPLIGISGQSRTLTLSCYPYIIYINF